MIPLAVVKQIAPTGRVRLAANMANASIISEIAPGQYAGPVADVAARLAEALQIEVQITPYASGGAILSDSSNWDLAVIAVDPLRSQVRYVHDVAMVSATLASLEQGRTILFSDVDRKGVKIATTRGAAYENYLRTVLSHAEIKSFNNPGAARDAMLRGECDFVAGIRTTLNDSFAGSPHITLMADDFLTITQALAVLAAHVEAAAYLKQVLG